jgi:hypothetical protein
VIGWLVAGLILLLVVSEATLIALEAWIENAPRRERWMADMQRAAAARQAAANRRAAELRLAANARAAEQARRDQPRTVVTWGTPHIEVSE